MSKKRRTFSPEFKAQVGLEALKGVEPVHVTAARHKAASGAGEPVEEGGVGATARGVAREKADRDAAEAILREKEPF